MECYLVSVVPYIWSILIGDHIVLILYNMELHRQYAKWFKNCNYVLMIKGQVFIERIIPPSREAMMKINFSSYIEKLKPPASIEKPENKPDKKPQTEVESVNNSANDYLLCKICYNYKLGWCSSLAYTLWLVLGVRYISMTSCPVCREPIKLVALFIIS
ncbi:GSCOCG00005361001-RA-CDS [Cotesia congregata]|nr:GSCOCG00005361001-RA-CDS [Cotesia congregata]